VPVGRGTHCLIACILLDEWKYYCKLKAYQRRAEIKAITHDRELHQKKLSNTVGYLTISRCILESKLLWHSQCLFSQRPCVPLPLPSSCITDRLHLQPSSSLRMHPINQLLYLKAGIWRFDLLIHEYLLTSQINPYSIISITNPISFLFPSIRSAAAAISCTRGCLTS